MAAPQVALILGSGPRVGAAVAKQLASAGFKIAVVSRSGKTFDQDFLGLTADFTDPKSIGPIFAQVKEKFNTYPSVVIYNAAGMTVPKEGDPLSVGADKIASDLNTNTISPWIAAQEAVKGWATLLPNAKKSFIFTGNAANTTIGIPLTVTLGIGKSASAYWIGVADAAYASKGYRFFYADERTEEGTLKGMKLDGDAHAVFYQKLVDHEGPIPWHATFTKEKGYAKFRV